MPHENQSRETTFGYLSAVHTAEHGYFGGYLIVSALGRPLEFHCTSPVRPSRAHEILYGPTLGPYLIGEQIGGTLLESAKLTPRLVLTDEASMLAVRPQAGVPVALVLSRVDDQCKAAIEEGAIQSGAVGGGGRDRRVWSPSCDGQFSIGDHELQLAPGYDADRGAVVESLALLAQHVDLAEPFGRIHEAICEAQRIGERSVEGHGQAA